MEDFIMHLVNMNKPNEEHFIIAFDSIFLL